MANIDKMLGKRIQEIRKQRGMTQSRLAELIDVEIITVSRIENGSRFPRKENLENIAKALDVKIVDLFDFEHEKNEDLLLNDIDNYIKKASINDLRYIYRLLSFYFENKNN